MKENLQPSAARDRNLAAQPVLLLVYMGLVRVYIKGHWRSCEIILDAYDGR